MKNLFENHTKLEYLKKYLVQLEEQARDIKIRNGVLEYNMEIKYDEYQRRQKEFEESDDGKSMIKL